MLLRDQMGELLTVQEVMNVLKVSRSTLHRMVKDGQLELLKVSRNKSLITERSLERLLEGLAHTKPPEA
jgi:excisionase family DNA binding protein